METIKRMFWRRSVLVNVIIAALFFVIGLAVEIVREQDGTQFCIGWF